MPTKEQYKANPEKYKAASLEAYYKKRGLGVPEVRQRWLSSQQGKESRLKSQRNWHRGVKIEVLTYYGGGKLACGVCKEARLACLSIDHLKGNGSAHRRSIKSIGGRHFYHWLKRQGFPEGYMTLCMNCQYIKRDINKEYGKQVII